MLGVPNIRPDGDDACLHGAKSNADITKAAVVSATELRCNVDLHPDSPPSPRGLNPTAAQRQTWASPHNKQSFPGSSSSDPTIRAGCNTDQDNAYSSARVRTWQPMEHRLSVNTDVDTSPKRATGGGADGALFRAQSAIFKSDGHSLPPKYKDRCQHEVWIPEADLAARARAKLLDTASEIRRGSKTAENRYGMPRRHHCRSSSITSGSKENRSPRSQLPTRSASANILAFSFDYIGGKLQRAWSTKAVRKKAATKSTKSAHGKAASVRTKSAQETPASARTKSDKDELAAADPNAACASGGGGPVAPPAYCADLEAASCQSCGQLYSTVKARFCEQCGAAAVPTAAPAERFPSSPVKIIDCQDLQTQTPMKRSQGSRLTPEVDAVAKKLEFEFTLC